jgi:hypothetical protein
VDIDGAVDMASTLAVGGLLTANAELQVTGTGTVAVFEATDGAAYIQIKDDDGTSGFIGVDAGSMVFQTPGSSFANKFVIASDGAATFSSSVSLGGNLAFTAADGMEILAKESLVVTIDSDDNQSSRIFAVRSGASGSYESLMFLSEDGGAVFNADALDKDFRVASDGNANMFVINGGVDKIGMGRSANLRDVVTITGADAGTGFGTTAAALEITNSDNSVGHFSALNFRVAAGNYEESLATVSAKYSSYSGNVCGQLSFGTRGASSTNVSERMRIDETGKSFFYGAVDVTGAATFASSINTNSDVVIAKSATGVPNLTLSGFAGASTAYSIINFYNEDGSQQGPNNAAQIKALAINTDGSGGSLDFHTSTGTGSNGADATKKVTIGGGGAFTTYPSAGQPTTFNEDGVDADFRVESNSYSHMLFVDAGNNGIGIANSSVEYQLDVGADGIAHAGGKTMRINSSGDTIFSLSRAGTSLFSMRNNATSYTALCSNNSADLILGYSTSDAGAIVDHLRFRATSTVFNEDGVDRDFRVESDANTHMLFVDGGNNNLMIGNTVVNPASGFSAQAGFGYAASGQVQIAATSNLATLVLGQNQGTNGSILDFRKQGTGVGSISVTGSATAYNTSSDQRLKENIADADDAGSKIDSIQVRKFDWKADGSHQDYGMVAQELQTVAPEAVSALEDPNEMMGVDYSKLVPMLIKEIQSLRQRVAQLEE